MIRLGAKALNRRFSRDEVFKSFGLDFRQEHVALEIGGKPLELLLNLGHCFGVLGLFLAGPGDRVEGARFGWGFTAVIKRGKGFSHDGADVLAPGDEQNQSGDHALRHGHKGGDTSRVGHGEHFPAHINHNEQCQEPFESGPRRVLRFANGPYGHTQEGQGQDHIGGEIGDFGAHARLNSFIGLCA